MKVFKKMIISYRYKDPGTGKDLQTTYTAGRRGFRARGPHIARRMDLSQTRPPFSRFAHFFLILLSLSNWCKG